MILELSKKVPISSFCVAEASFRIKGEYFVTGEIVIDVDTFNFVGKFADDYVVGWYEDECYAIMFYRAINDYSESYDGELDSVEEIVMICENHMILSVFDLDGLKIESEDEKFTFMIKDFVNDTDKAFDVARSCSHLVDFDS